MVTCDRIKRLLHPGETKPRFSGQAWLCQLRRMMDIFEQVRRTFKAYQDEELDILDVVEDPLPEWSIFPIGTRMFFIEAEHFVSGTRCSHFDSAFVYRNMCLIVPFKASLSSNGVVRAAKRLNAVEMAVKRLESLEEKNGTL